MSANIVTFVRKILYFLNFGEDTWKINLLSSVSYGSANTPCSFKSNDKLPATWKITEKFYNMLIYLHFIHFSSNPTKWYFQHQWIDHNTENYLSSVTANTSWCYQWKQYSQYWMPRHMLSLISVSTFITAVILYPYTVKPALRSHLWDK